MLVGGMAWRSARHALFGPSPLVFWILAFAALVMAAYICYLLTSRRRISLSSSPFASGTDRPTAPTVHLVTRLHTINWLVR